MFDIRITTTDAPQIPWEKIAKAVLGTSYELSLIVCADTLARRVNKETRKKTYSPNVLSFPMTETEGEIVLNIRKAKREAAEYAHTYTEHVVYLFIHGLLHLKGMDHGDTMENAEKHFLKRFKDTYKHATHHHRN
jgi:probable rRNA maturation factor